MKKLAVLLTILCLLPLSACHRQRYGILSYQQKDIYAECLLNDEYKIAVTQTKSEKSVSFLEPSSLSSISFRQEEEKIIGRAGEVEIPFENMNLDGICAILSIFSLDESNLGSVTGTSEATCMEFTSSLGTYKVTLGKNELPKRIEILSEEYEFDIVIEAIRLN